MQAAERAKNTDQRCAVSIEYTHRPHRFAAGEKNSPAFDQPARFVEPLSNHEAELACTDAEPGANAVRGADRGADRGEGVAPCWRRGRADAANALEHPCGASSCSSQGVAGAGQKNAAKAVLGGQPRAPRFLASAFDVRQGPVVALGYRRSAYKPAGLMAIPSATPSC